MDLVNGKWVWKNTNLIVNSKGICECPKNSLQNGTEWKPIYENMIYYP